MTKKEQEALAVRFCKAIKDLADRPEALDNLECYLSNCFEGWVTKYANCPQNITADLEAFANMYE